MSHRRFRTLGVALLLTATGVLGACSSSTTTSQGPLSKSGDIAEDAGRPPQLRAR